MYEKWHEITNIGWTLGNDCPYKCNMCYSKSQRNIGRNLNKGMADRIIEQLEINSIVTVNFGGNEPIFTCGTDPRKSLLPYIIRSLVDKGMAVGLTSAGITINYMYNRCFDSLRLLNDIDISLDSPFEEEHNTNRGAALFKKAVKALKRCQELNIPHTIVLCGMKWNLTPRHFDELIVLAKKTNSNIRINFLRPTEDRHLDQFPSAEEYYRTISTLLDYCEPVDIGEPTLNSLKSQGSGCPCGISSLRINSITPDGKIPVSPCVYTHDFKTGDLLRDDLLDIINMPSFTAFRERHDQPERIEGCADCAQLNNCRGGCASRAYYSEGSNNKRFDRRDCYCHLSVDQKLIQEVAQKLQQSKTVASSTLVHQNYLCTLILKPK